jgi:hypothetical protein
VADVLSLNNCPHVVSKRKIISSKCSGKNVLLARVNTVGDTRHVL